MQNLNGAHILLAEDNEINAYVAKTILEQLSCAVDVAENGQTAVDKFAQSAENSYDVIFMDVHMPVMDGIEAAREIRKIDRKDAAAIPILAVSANAFQDDIKRSLEAGIIGGYYRCAMDEGYPFLYVRRRFLDMLGWTEEELREKFGNKFMNYIAG